MALTKSMDFYGDMKDMYLKISGITLEDGTPDEEGKWYIPAVRVDLYTNSTKKYHVNQDVKKLSPIRASELSYEDAYSGLTTLPEYEGFTNC